MQYLKWYNPVSKYNHSLIYTKYYAGNEWGRSINYLHGFLNGSIMFPTGFQVNLSWIYFFNLKSNSQILFGAIVSSIYWIFVDHLRWSFSYNLLWNILNFIFVCSLDVCATLKTLTSQSSISSWHMSMWIGYDASIFTENVPFFCMEFDLNYGNVIGN